MDGLPGNPWNWSQAVVTVPARAVKPLGLRSRRRAPCAGAQRELGARAVQLQLRFAAPTAPHRLPQLSPSTSPEVKGQEAKRSSPKVRPLGPKGSTGALKTASTILTPGAVSELLSLLSPTTLIPCVGFSGVSTLPHFHLSERFLSGLAGKGRKQRQKTPLNRKECSTSHTPSALAELKLTAPSACSRPGDGKDRRDPIKCGRDVQCGSEDGCLWEKERESLTCFGFSSGIWGRTNARPANLILLTEISILRNKNT